MTIIPGPIVRPVAEPLSGHAPAPLAPAPSYPQQPSTPGRATDDVYVEPGLTPLGAREANRSTVADLLRSAGVSFFAVRGASDHGTVLAVAEEDREVVLGALFRGMGQYAGHLSVIDPQASVPVVPGPRGIPRRGVVSVRPPPYRSAGFARTQADTC
ncbi:hypothetical protein [Streptomyces fulvorobeus]|uniref:hypothetical protein n=1 Tax=Streptomyces fulvorobeus TaxID=284028 RepID=UPI002115572F|nr:hypothetical protein [Streptomyces fulvorobeus]